VYHSLDFALSDNSYNFSNGGSLWSHDYFYTSPHFWTAVVVLVLAFFLILQNAYSFRKYVARPSMPENSITFMRIPIQLLMSART
jgi:hypothetical protein